MDALLRRLELDDMLVTIETPVTRARHWTARKLYTIRKVRISYDGKASLKWTWWGLKHMILLGDATFRCLVAGDGAGERYPQSHLEIEVITNLSLH